MNAILCLPFLMISPGYQTSGPPIKGHVLILDNDRTLEGEIEKVGDSYRLRRGDAITWIPGQSSAVLCPDLPSALKALRQRANLQDPDERMRLAQWCLARNLKELALEEAKASLALRPEHAQTARFVRHLETREAPAVPVRHATTPSEADTKGLQLTIDSLSLYTRSVQPILMNACATCHATEKGGNFRLIRSYDPGLGNRRTLQANIAAVLNQISTSSPMSSPLLVKSVSVHGGQSHPSLKGRQSEPYRLLEDWVRMVSEEHAVSRPAEPNLLPAGFASDDKKGRTRPVSPEIQQADFKKADSVATPSPVKFAENKPIEPMPAAPAPSEEKKPASGPDAKPPTSPAGPDPYDPGPFNQLPANKNP